MKKTTLLFALASSACAFAGALEDGFANPPNENKPRVWWHWMNGNVSKAGITADLEAMAKAGIGGAHLFDAGCEIPPGPVAFNTPAWVEHVKYAAQEARFGNHARQLVGLFVLRRTVGEARIRDEVRDVLGSRREGRRNVRRRFAA